ncbi:FAD-binding oxidoreductase [Candidatus Kaiserbacteria bacterium]|nr:FAD-binding oxidoreductase [Candidatus Kaiserbacteria bacterium]MCB9811774.1 FAD-binding oxidoreductase [Candidatus Nomurabacteria bacterium]
MAGSSTANEGVLSLTVRDADASTARPKAKKSAAKKKVVKKSAKKKAPAKKTAKKAAAKTPTKTKPVSQAQKVAVKKTPARKKTTTKSEPASAFPTAKELLQSVRRQPLGHLMVEQMLRQSGFRGTVSTDKELLEKYSTDESIFAVRPQIVLQPRDQRDVEVAVKTLGKETKRFPSLSLTPRAAGTGLSGGSLTDSVVIDVSKHMTHIDALRESKDSATFSCQPGAMWRDVEAMLKKNDRYLPPYPASKDICSIGGAVGNNAAGPDSLRYGHVADWVEALDVTLCDGNTYTIKPLTYKEYQALVKKDNAHSRIAKEVFALIEKNEAAIKKAKPKTKKNSAGYALWSVFDTSVKDFKKGIGTFDLTRLISGSQGTIGVVTKITMRTEPICHHDTLIAVPVFDLADASSVVLEALKYDPINIEIFDALTFDLAMKNPNFFRTRLSGIDYYKVLLSMYTTYHVRYSRKVPEFTLLVTLDNDTLTDDLRDIVRAVRESGGKKARVVKNPSEKEMLWQIRRASYSLSKLEDPNKRPAAFLEDMTVPPKNMGKFFTEIKKLLKKYHVTAAVHGHGGNGHFHFYPLLDFTSKATPALVEKMSEEFFKVAVKYDGNICGEHNDGIIRTPHLSKMFNKKTLDLFKQVEHAFDPDDIFNPGKKVNPRFDIKSTIRHKN